MKTQHIKGNTYCTDIHGTCTGIFYADERQVILIDSGRYESPELFDWLEESGLLVIAVLHTHLHIDHIANSSELSRRYGARLYSSENEPFEYYVEFETEHYPSQGNIFGDFRIIPTPGHSPGHCMIVTPDNIGFVGDAVLSEDFLKRTVLPYMDFIRASICSMKAIKRAGLDACVCSHNGIIDGEDISRVVDMNIQKEFDLFELLEESVNQPVPRDVLIDLFMCNAGIWDQQTRQYGYMIDTVSFRINELIEEGRFTEKDGIIYPV